MTAARFRGDGYAVSTECFKAATPAGTRTLQNVVAVRQGMASSAIVVVADRDALGSPVLAEQSGTGVLLELGRVLSAATLSHTVVLASTTGSTGTAGAAQLAATLGRPVDAVLVLGDMAGIDLSRPLVVAWSDGQQLAPALLANTVRAELRLQAGLNAGSPSLPDQLAHLAFPLALTEQGPIDARGLPAVRMSASGDIQPPAAEPISRTRITRFGRTALQTVGALDGSARIRAPGSYLILAGKEIPTWALRLLVLALILPVTATALDGLLRAGRRRPRAACDARGRHRRMLSALVDTLRHLHAQMEEEGMESRAVERAASHPAVRRCVTPAARRSSATRAPRRRSWSRAARW